MSELKTNDKTAANNGKEKDIYFAGGCFWGVEEYFSRIPGVTATTVGYANGTTDDPTYAEVCRNHTGYAETVHVTYDPEDVSLKTLTEHFFKIINPISVNKQGFDVGTQYRSGVYYSDEQDVTVLQPIFQEVGTHYYAPLATELKPIERYYLAEEEHQDYLKKNPGGYCHVDFSSLADVVK